MSKISTESVIDRQTTDLVVKISKRVPGDEWKDEQKAIEQDISEYVDNLTLKEAKETLHSLHLERVRIKNYSDALKATQKTIRDALLREEPE